jgi:hypothetical protein
VTTPLRYPLVTIAEWSGNVIDDDGVAWWVRDWSGWDETPDIRATSDGLPGSDGGTEPNPLFGPRFPQWHGVAQAPTPALAQAAARRFASLLAVTRSGTLTVDDGSLVLSSRVLLHGNSPVFIRWVTDVWFEFGISLVAPDPRKYGPAVEVTTGMAGSSGGVSFPLVFPLDFGASAGGVVTLVNDGTVKSWPVIRISGPVVNPRILNPVTGDSLRVGMTINAGEYVDIDTAARTVLLQGTASRRAVTLSTGEWMPVPPGGASFSFGADAYSAAASMTVSARSAWT